MRTNALGISSSIIKPELYLRDGEQRKEGNKERGAVKLVKMGQGQRHQGTPSAGFPTGSPAHHIGPFRSGGKQKKVKQVF